MYRLLFLIPLFFIACSTKKINFKTAQDIHKNIYKAIYSDLDKADELFLTLQANYPASEYIKIDLLALFYAHLKEEEYELAKFYLDEYEKRFANKKEKEWCEYQKIKIDFFSYQNAYTNEGKILDILKKCENYTISYPNSKFLYEVNTIYAKVYLTKLYLYDKINKLYIKLNKPKSAEKYRVKIPKSTPPKIPIYKKIFYW